MLGNLWSPVSAENANQPQGTLLGGGGASLAGGYSLGNNAAGQGSAYQGQQQPFETIYRLPQTNAAGQQQQPQSSAPVPQSYNPIYTASDGNSASVPPPTPTTVSANGGAPPLDAAGRPMNPFQFGYAIDASGKPMPVQSGYEIDASGKPMQQPGGFNSNPQQGSLSSLGKSIPNGVQQGMQQYAPLAQMGGGFGF